MGIMSKLLGSSKPEINPTNGGAIQNTDQHAINKQTVLGNTSSDVVSPTNANFTSIRTAPVVQAPRYFNKQEAEALKQMAKLKRDQAEAARQAYKALKSIDNSDLEVHQTHRIYQGKVAQNEVDKLQANTRLAEKLHGLRPQYQQLSSRVDTAENNASLAINAIRDSYGV